MSLLNLKKKEKIQSESKVKINGSGYPFKISVIIPVYNTEDYIQETLDSIYNQTMDLSDIQIILVNDGSTDGTHEILKRNANLHPDSIVYINKENEGVSKARNTGIEYATGKYINFIDSDDKWGTKTFEEAYNFLESHPEIDIVSSRLAFFDNLIGEHPLNYKFDKQENKVVNLLEEYDNIQMHASSSFFRKSAIGNIRFDDSLKYAEDAKFVYEVLKKTYKLGLLSYTKGCYFYRKRADESSAIDTAHYKETFYLPTLEKYHQFLLDDSIKNLGYLPKYIQTILLYDLQYRLKYSDTTMEQLNETTLKEYTSKILDLLSNIDDDLLNNTNLKVLNVIYQTAILKEKYPNKKIEIINEDNEHKVYFGDVYLKSIEDMYLKNESMYLKNGVLKLAFSLPLISDEVNVEPVISYGKNRYIKANKASVLSEHQFLGKKVSQTNFYSFNIPLKKFSSKFTINYLISDKYLTNVNKVSKTLKTNFSNTAIPFKHFDKSTIRLYDNKTFKVTGQKKYLTVKNILGLLSRRGKRKSAIYKIIGLKLKAKNTERIWLFTDRLDQAEDNAEAMFDYVYQNHKEISPYFLINKNCSDYKRLRKKYKSKVVAFNSKKHHFLMFKAERLLTSHTEGYLFNPFGVKNGKNIRELLDFDFVFLQHGVTQNNVSKLFHKYNKPIDYFVTSAQRETNDILEKYGFLENEVIQTGLSRFDLLKNEPVDKKIVAFMPTWRPQLLLGTDEEFLTSKFFKKTYDFLNDEKLKKWINNGELELQFHLHPRMRERFSKFYKNLNHIHLTESTNYKRVISESSLLITDVSSVAFDIAYLNKPIVYYQFDLDDIYRYAIYTPGYFSYKEDGFGPVIPNEENLIQYIEEIKNNSFEMDSKYKERTKTFFAFQDNQNRQRLFNKIN